MASGWGVGGRPTIWHERRLEDYPPPTPQPTVCRLWQGAVDRDGYGMISVTSCDMAKGGRKRAYRWVWEAVNGPIPEGLVVRHKCDNRPCFRLSHLELGTVADNNRDTRERNHAGKPWKLSPSQVERVRAEHEAGVSLYAIHREWAGEFIGYAGLKYMWVKIAAGIDPDTPIAAPPGWVPRDKIAKLQRAESEERAKVNKYSGWRDGR